MPAQAQKEKEKPEAAPEEPTLMEKLEAADKAMQETKAENEALRKLLNKVLPPSQRADDGRPWEFEPKDQQLGTGNNQRYAPILCKDFVPMTARSPHCIRTGICKNARRVGKSIGCEAGLDGKKL